MPDNVLLNKDFSVMVKISLISLFVVSNIVICAHAADVDDRLLECSRSMEAYGTGSSFNLNESVQLIGAAEREHGFYAYTRDVSYFCTLPKKADHSDSSANYYSISLKIPGEKITQYLTYTKAKGSINGSGFSVQPDPESKTKYFLKSKCTAYKDDKSQAAMEQAVKERIISASKLAKQGKTSTKEKLDNDYASNDEQLTENKNKLIGQYPKSLAKCSKLNSEIGKLAEQELKKVSPTQNNKRNTENSSFSK